MNPNTNKFEQLREAVGPDAEAKLREMVNAANHRLEAVFAEKQIHEPEKGRLLRADGSPVPTHWPVFAVNESIVVKGYTFKVAHIGESHMLLEPVGPLVVGADEKECSK